ncbi:Endomembrane protein 70-domain-containing protein, partial [Endogone sp. FLAS-F59071]
MANLGCSSPCGFFRPMGVARNVNFHPTVNVTCLLKTRIISLLTSPLPLERVLSMPESHSHRPRAMPTLFLIFALLLLVPAARAFYLPGVAPQDYIRDKPVNLFVNSLTPLGANQQVRSVIAYDYYYPPFHMCVPKDGPQKQPESLGSILFGDRIFNSPYELSMLKNESCKFLCTSQINKEDVEFIKGRIIENYAVNWIIDGLPAARHRTDERTQQPIITIGFELGFYIESEQLFQLFNHHDIVINYHTQDNINFRVVSVTVYPSSKEITFDTEGNPNCQTNTPLYLSDKENNTVTYTYQVLWKPSSTVWATRWDNYLHVYDPNIHWFSLVNSVVIVLFLTGMVAMILLRALHKDISRYNAVDAQEDVQEDFGWKLVHGDVFRPPAHSMLLSVMLGNGAQLFFMAAVTLVFAVLGFLSPSNRGSLATAMIVLYMLFGSVAGHVSARVYKLLGGESWRTNIALTAFLIPGFIFGCLVLLNFFLIGVQSSGAVPFGTMLAIVGLWFLVSAPLSFIGSYFGFKKPRLEHPVRTNQIPRQIPDQVFYLRPIPSMLMGGVLPFGAIFIELYFIMNSIWFHRIYYVFGFLFLVFGILVLTCAEVTILMCYFHLCAEDYHWWWRAFLTSGASALYVFLYSALYYATRLQIDSFTSTVLYFGWSFIMSTLFFILTGGYGEGRWEEQSVLSDYWCEDYFGSG